MASPLPTLVTLDGNWLVHRAYHAAGQSPEEARPRMVARQVTAWAFSYGLLHQATHLLAAFDGARCFRYDVWPLYKAKRKAVIDEHGNPLPPEEALKLIESGVKLARAPDPIHDCQILTQQLLEEYGVPVFHPPKHEADDVLSSAATLVEKRPKELRKVVLITQDKDILQSLRPGVSQWHPHHDRKKPPVTITHRDLSNRLTAYVHEDAANWTPKQFRGYQILIGDPTDDVPQILSAAKARKILNKHASLQDYFATEEGKDFYFRNQQYLRRNYQLVVMKEDLLDEMELDTFRYKAKALPRELCVAPSPALRGAHADYVGWLKLSARRSLF